MSTTVETGLAATPTPARTTAPVVAMGGAVVLALLTGAGLLLTAGANPLDAYWEMLKGTTGSRSDISLVLVEVVPLLLMGMGLAIAFRARLWNIGAEGQAVVGALVGGWFAISVPIDAKVPMIAAACIVGALGGALWGAVVGALKARWRVNEVIASLLLNYVAIFTLNYAVRKPLREPGGFQPASETLPDSARLPEIPGGFRVHVGLLVALALVPLVMYLMARTPFGFRVRMLGLNAEAAEAAGVRPGRMYIAVLAISGAFAGLAGIMQVMGPETRLTNNLATGAGFTAIIVALIGRLHPIGVLLASVFIGMLTLGGDVVQRTQQVPRTLTLVIQAVFVLFLLVAEKLARRS